MTDTNQSQLPELFLDILLQYITHDCTLLLNNKYNADANLDAFDNVISGNETSSEMLTS